MNALSMNGYGYASESLMTSCLNHIRSGFRLKMGDVSKTKGHWKWNGITWLEI